MNIVCTRDGVATLPTIVAMAILVLAVSIGVSLTSFSESFVSEGQSKTSKAYGYAEAGMRDAMRRISINKNASSSYTIAFVTGGCDSSFAGCATITISTSTGSVADPKIIISVGRVGSFSRQIQSNVVFDTARTGKIVSVTKQETAVSASVVVATSSQATSTPLSLITGFVALNGCIDTGAMPTVGLIELWWNTPNDSNITQLSIRYVNINTDTATWADAEPIEGVLPLPHAIGFTPSPALGTVQITTINLSIGATYKFFIRAGDVNNIFATSSEATVITSVPGGSAACGAI